MIRPSLPPRGRALKRYAAFTLIELLTVIAIILVLAGLLLHIAGSANEKSSRARATAEVQAMSTALESYKADNGAYPRPPTVNTASDQLNAQSSTASNPGGTDSALFQAAGRLLYQSLGGLGADGVTITKRYMEFKPSQLSTGTANPTNMTYIIDPFGLCYGYSTAAAYQNDLVQAGTTTPAAAAAYGYNPTFDLWSTGGYGTGGKGYPGDVNAAAYNTLWLKNW